MKLNPALAQKLNLSQSQSLRNYRHSDLDRRTSKTKEKLVEAYKPLLTHIKSNASEQWLHAKPTADLIPDVLIKKHSDVLAQANIYSEILGRVHTKRQRNLQLSKALYQDEINDLMARKVISIAEYKLLDEYEKLLCFSMAKVSDTRLLQDVRQTLVDAVEQGQTFSSWKSGIDNVFDDAGVTKLNGYYLENVYRTNTFSAYMAGRWRTIYADIENIAFLRRMELPNCCEEHCLQVDGLTAPPLDPIWNEYGGLMHYQCKGDLEIIYKDEAHGVKKSQRSLKKPMEGFGGKTIDQAISPSILQQAQEMGIKIDFRGLRKILDKLNSLGG